MNPIRVWRFEDAPEEFRRLSRCGGDEDWVAHVPAQSTDLTKIPPKALAARGD